MLRTVRPVLRSYNIQRCCRSTVAAVDGAQQVLTDYDKAKPFHEIPGPRGLPYLGTMLQYRKGTCTFKLNPCHTEEIKMPFPLLIVSQSDYLM